MHVAFGLRLRTSLELPWPPGGTAAVDLAVEPADAADVARRFSGPADPPAVDVHALGDGTTFRVERGRAGDYAIDHAPRGVLHLETDERVLRCAPVDPHDPAWRRFLFDTALGTASLALGFDALHAGAAVTPSGLLAIVAATGGGKSTLLAELVARGHDLFTDDILAIEEAPDGVIAHPGPPLMNLSPGVSGRLPDDVGRVLAWLDGEAWTAVERGATGPVPVAAVALLERGDTADPVIERLDASPVALLPHSLLSGLSAARLRRRFDVLADLASQARLLRVAVPESLEPGAIAELLLASL